jgi:hypothetical protein
MIAKKGKKSFTIMFKKREGTIGVRKRCWEREIRDNKST